MKPSQLEITTSIQQLKHNKGIKIVTEEGKKKEISDSYLRVFCLFYFVDGASVQPGAFNLDALGSPASRRRVTSSRCK